MQKTMAKTSTRGAKKGEQRTATVIADIVESAREVIAEPRSNLVAASRKRYRECAVWFQAIQRDARRATAQLTNIVESMRIARLVSASLQFMFFFTQLENAPLDNILIRSMRDDLGPLETQHIGSPFEWARRVGAFSKMAVKDIFSSYPYALKSVALHKTAQKCERAVYFDADVLLFRDARELLQLLQERVNVSMLAPPETSSQEYCRQYAAEFGSRNCSALDQVSLSALSKLILQYCPEKAVQGSSTLYVFQASVMVMSNEMLELWVERQFLLEYLVLVLRILDGSRHLIAAPYRFSVPVTNAPIPFPSVTETNVIIAEQIAYYIIFSCGDAQVGVLDRTSVLSGLNPEVATSLDIENCSHSVMAWHTQAQYYADALLWYAHQHERCTSVENFVR